MRVVKVKAFGSADHLVEADVPDLIPGTGQMVVGVEAIGVGLVDVLKRRGSIGGEPGFVPGSEIAGRVIAVGRDVDEGLIGRKVFAHGGGGGYADQFLTSASVVIFIPEEVSSNEAIALGLNSLVAVFSQRQSRLKRGDRVLVRGGSGGVGLASIQVAARSGAVVAAITNSAAASKVTALGARQVFCRDKGEAPEGSFDVIIDPVGGDAVGDHIGALAANGRYVLVGAAGGFPAPGFGAALFANFQKSPTFSVFSMASIPPRDVKEAAEEIFAAGADGKLAPIIAGVFPLSDAAKAHRALESGMAIGKVILRAKV